MIDGRPPVLSLQEEVALLAGVENGKPLDARNASRLFATLAAYRKAKQLNDDRFCGERDEAEAKAHKALDQRDAVEAAAKVFLAEQGVRCQAIGIDCDRLATRWNTRRGRAFRCCDKHPPAASEIGWTDLPQAALVRLLGDES